jgi:hypothetical protein
MVYGNMGDESGTGVAFTRDGATGDEAPMGEYLINAQGEDVVAGIRTPKHIDDMPKEKSPVWKKAHAQLMAIMKKLEKHYKYPQDVEFTVEQARCGCCRPATPSAPAWPASLGGGKGHGKDFYTGKPGQDPKPTRRSHAVGFRPRTALFRSSTSRREEGHAP